MDLDSVKDFLFIFSLGAGFGFLSISLSGVSEGLFGLPLGFAKFNLKNVVKSSAPTGTAFTGLVPIEDKFGIMKQIEAEFDL